MLVFFFLEPILIIDLFLYRCVLSWSHDNTWSLSSVPASWTSSPRTSGLEPSGLEPSGLEPSGLEPSGLEPWPPGTSARCLGGAADDILLPRQLLECSMIPEAARACGRPCAVHSAPALSATPSARRPQRALSAPSARPQRALSAPRPQRCGRRLAQPQRRPGLPHTSSLVSSRFIL